jgi:hypothetical protein
MKKFIVFIKSPALLFFVGIVFILTAVFIHSLNFNDLLKVILFILGIIIEGIAIILFIKKYVV